MLILPSKIGLYWVFRGQKDRFSPNIMARAKRHFIPGYIWHITHRCHKREFLLKFSKDRYRYLQWLYQARKRYGLKILNYMVTSNHIHLLVVDDGARDVIPNSMNWWPDGLGKNTIRGRFEKEPTGKIVIMQLLKKAAIIWQNAWFTLTRIWSVQAWSAIHPCGLSAVTMRSRNPEGRTS